MFENDLTSLSTPDLLESAAAHRAEVNRLDARLLEHAQLYADRHHPDICPTRPGRRHSDGRELAIVLGGDGCPEIAEFAPVEFGAMIGISPGAAADFIGQAQALRYRLPLTWARVLAREATPWKARKIATACLDLSEDAARDVDRRVARVVDSLTPQRLDKLIEAAKKHADPEGARKKADEKKRERGVYLGRSDEHGTRTTFIRAASGAVTRHDATIAAIAEALKTFGDTRTVQARRADAVGIIADPAYTQELLHQAREFLKTAPQAPATPGAANQAADAPTTDSPAQSAPASPAEDANTAGAAGDAIPAEDANTAGAGRDATPAEDADAPSGSRAQRDAAAAADVTTDASTTRDRSAASTTGQDAAPVTAAPARSTGSDRDAPARGTGRTAGSVDVDPAHDDLLNDWLEPGLDDEADRDAPHPSHSDLPDPLDAPFAEAVEPFEPGLRLDADDGHPLDDAARRALDARLAQIRHDAHTNPRMGRPSRPGQTEIYVHLTDHTLATGTGVLRVEGIAPLLADQLSEIVGHGPYTVKPVIDLNDAVSVDAYEIPDRIRERVKLTYPVEVFPYGTRETHPAMDLDHIEPYDPLGPPGQTNTANLAPLRRFPHRVKTHGRWKIRRLDRKTLEWTTPNGFIFHVDPTGTHRVPKRLPDT